MENIYDKLLTIMNLVQPIGFIELLKMKLVMCNLRSQRLDVCVFMNKKLQL